MEKKKTHSQAKIRGKQVPITLYSHSHLIIAIFFKYT